MDPFQFRLRMILASRMLVRRRILSGGCWTFPDTGHEYSRIRLDRKEYYAHRIIFWVIGGGWVERDEVICHRCDNPRCWNPEHLMRGNQTENLQDCAQKGRLNSVKLTPSQVQQIRIMIKKGIKDKVVARIFEVSASTIRHIRKRRHWQHVS